MRCNSTICYNNIGHKYADINISASALFCCALCVQIIEIVLTMLEFDFAKIILGRKKDQSRNRIHVKDCGFFFKL
jgi:hypothetical protein